MLVGNVPPNSFQQQASGAVSQGHLKQQQGGGGKEVDNVSRQVIPSDLISRYSAGIWEVIIYID